MALRLPRVEALNALFGGVAIGLVWALLRHRAWVAPGVAPAATAGAATSFGVWFYSVSVEVYVPPLTLLLATLLILTTPWLTLPAMAAVGVLNWLAVLAHQSNVLFAAVVVVVAVHRIDWRSRADPARRLRRHRHGCGGRRLRGGAVPRRSAGLARRGHGLVHPLRPGVRRPAHTPRAWPALVGFSLFLALRSLRLPLRRCPRPGRGPAFPGKSLDDEIFLVRHLSPAGAALLVAARGGWSDAGSLGAGRGLLAGARNRPEPALRLARSPGAWIIVYTCFFVVWEPTNVEFWIPQVTALWMLAAVLVEGRRAAVAPGVAAGAVAIANRSAPPCVPPTPPTTSTPCATRPSARSFGRATSSSSTGPTPASATPCATRRPHWSAATSVSVVVALEDTSPPPAEMLIDRAARAFEPGHRVAVDADLVVAPSGGAAGLHRRPASSWFAARWRVVDEPGPPGDWYLIDPPPGAASGS